MGWASGENSKEEWCVGLIGELGMECAPVDCMTRRLSVVVPPLTNESASLRIASPFGVEICETREIQINELQGSTEGNGRKRWKQSVERKKPPRKRISADHTLSA